MDRLLPSTVQRGSYYPALDGFRAVAVLMVFSVHYVGYKTPLLHNWGWMGVDFFFVLSGFLITGILYDSRARPHHVRDFYARRVLRIFPLYYAVWLVLLLLAPVFQWQWNREWILWPLHLGNLARFLFLDPANLVHLDVLRGTRHTLVWPAVYMGHFWSLCVEEQFYLIWPPVVFLIGRLRPLVLVSAAIVVLEPFLRWGLWLHLSPALLNAEFLARFTLTRVDALALGGLLALLLRSDPGARAMERYGRAFTLGSIALFAAMMVEYAHRNHGIGASLTDPVLSTFGLTAVDLLGAGLILELIRHDSPVAKVMSWKPLRRLGQVSYGFYVFHDLPHSFYAYLARMVPRLGGPETLTVAVIAMTGTLLLSFSSYALLEKPFLKMKAYFPGQTHLAPKA